MQKYLVEIEWQVFGLGSYNNFVEYLEEILANLKKGCIVLDFNYSGEFVCFDVAVDQ